MIARGFKPVAWVAAIGAAALSCYMLSLRVASERAELANLDQRIIAARQAIRSLQTELGTRGRLQQLEQWNTEVLALSAPVAGQFVESNISLARFDTRARDFGDQQADVRLASAEAGQSATTPAASQVAPVASPAAPRMVLAAARPDQVTKPNAAPPMIQRASLATADRPTAATRAPVERVALAPRPAAERRPVAQRPAAARPTVAVRNASAPARGPSLLNDDVLRDLRSEARAERSGGTRN